MKTCGTNLPSVYLKPGEIYIGTKPTKVSTILGSCISVTLYNPRLKVGTICHGILPTYRNAQTGDNDCENDFKYVDYSIAIMLDQFDSLGVKHKEIDVKIFGGADMIYHPPDSTGVLTVGKQNLQTAMQIIKKESLRLLSHNVGGLFGRKIIFYTHTGDVLLKQIVRSDLLSTH